MAENDHHKVARPFTRRVFFKVGMYLFGIALISMFFFGKYWETEKVIEWDVSHYYSYLPATFIYEDLQFDDKDTTWTNRQFKFVQVPGGKSTKMTMGLSMVWAPFFLTAHGIAQGSERFSANGFSLPYRYALLFSASLFAFIGVYALGRFLLFYFNEKVAVITSVSIFLGTNLPFYTLVSPMSHVYSFALVSLLLWQTHLYLQRDGSLRALFIGVLAGLIILIRPINGIILLYPILSLTQRGGSLAKFRSVGHLAIAILAGFLVVLPQLLYWQYMTGSWVVYSYGPERFFFSDPEIWKGLFSYRKGWLVYSPLMFVAGVGLLLFMKKYPKPAISIITVLATALWVTFSWWCWWYGGGFGARTLIDFLPFMALGLGAAIYFISRQKVYTQWAGVTIIVLFTCYGLFMNWQYNEGIIHFDSMTKELYWDNLLQMKLDVNYWSKLDPPDYEAALKNENR